MVESFFGIVLASIVSVTLLTSIVINNKEVKNAGRNNLSNNEVQIIKKAGYTDEEVNIINIDIKNIQLDWNEKNFNFRI